MNRILLVQVTNFFGREGDSLQEYIYDVLNDDLLLDLCYSSPWIELNAFDWTELSKGQPKRIVKKNDMVFTGDTVNQCAYIIEKGRVRLSVFSESGDEQAVTIAQAGCMIGEVSLFDKKPNIVYAIAITDLELTVITQKVLNEKFLASPHLQFNIVNNLIRKIRLLYSQIEDISFRSAVSRVALTLLRLNKEYGIPTKDGHKITIRFTHQEVGGITGLCRVSVSKIMSDLSNSNIISKVDGYIIIHDLFRLKALI